MSTATWRVPSLGKTIITKSMHFASDSPTCPVYQTKCTFTDSGHWKQACKTACLNNSVQNQSSSYAVNVCCNSLKSIHFCARASPPREGASSVELLVIRIRPRRSLSCWTCLIIPYTDPGNAVGEQLRRRNYWGPRRPTCQLGNVFCTYSVSNTNFCWHLGTHCPIAIGP